MWAISIQKHLQFRAIMLKVHINGLVVFLTEIRHDHTTWFADHSGEVTVWCGVTEGIETSEDPLLQSVMQNFRQQLSSKSKI
jgi:hypothetical protein